jgi:NAD-dependent SIR2 family protein deacetylase
VFHKNAARAAELIRSADALVIAAGAGMGVDSGLPDFTEVASTQALLSDPAWSWGFYGHCLSLYRHTPPHAGFGILKKWADRTYLGARVITSNVDGHFHKAGFAPEHLREFHGSIHYLQCMSPCNSGVWSADNFDPQMVEANRRLLNAPPTCPKCGGLARPNIQMFGDSTWLSKREKVQLRFEEKWYQRLSAIDARAVVIEIGAGTARPLVRLYSEQISWKYDAPMVRINARDSKVPSAKDVGITADALEALLAIDSLLTQ